MIFDPQKRNAFLPIIFSIILISGIWIGYFLSLNFASGLNTFHHKKEGNGEKINSLLDYIEYQYVDTINKSDLVEKTVTAMLQNLDPHSSYIPASEFEMTNESLEGNFDGIGVEFNIIKDTIRIISVIEGGPSEKAGLKAGDRLIKVEEINMTGPKISNKEVFDKLRGKSGSIVNITIFRHGILKPVVYKITRGTIPIYSIDASYMLNSNIGYIKISKFGSTTYDEYIKAFNELTKLGMKKMILDLRGNPGGYLNAAVDISDEFLKKGMLIVYTEGKSSAKRTYNATERGSFENNDVVVLIDEGSASASEIVAGALQDNDRGLIVGRRSFGKGLVQDQLQLPDGSAIRLTVARYYTPTGRCIQKPYSDDKTLYYSEEYERFHKGELLSADSIKLDKTKQYKTPEGKIVFGGGGIMPDIFVPIDTSISNSNLNQVFNTGIINSFAFDYVDKNRVKLNEYIGVENFMSNFEISNTILSEFYVYCINQKLDIKKVFEKKINDALRIYLKAFIGRYGFKKDIYYPIVNKNDKCIQVAIENLLKQTSTFTKK